MAKAGFYLYGTSGKVGNIVARRGRKGTVLAERKFSIKNPRTNKQMAQRIILATVAQAAKFLSPIVDHSFQGKSIGTISKEYFRKINMNRLRKLAAIDFENASSGLDSLVFMSTKNIQALIPNSYIISEGNIAGSKLSLSTQNIGGRVGEGKEFIVTIPAANISTVTGDTQGVRYVTLGALMQALFGLTTAGEQLTFVGIEKTGEGAQFIFNNEPENPGWMIPYTGLIARRLFIDPSVDMTTKIAVTDAQGAELASLTTDIVAAIKQAFTNARTDDVLLSWLETVLSDSNNYDVTDQVLNIAATTWNYTQDNAADDDLGYLYALGIVRSRLNTDATWQYSKTILTMNLPTVVNSTNFGLNWNAAIQAWFQGENVAEVDMYLQGGTDQNTIGESFT